jgi:hypothetical protein
MTTTRLIRVALLSSLIGCGGGSGNQPPDAAQGSAAARITIAGTAQAQSGSSTPLAGVAISAYRNSDEATPIATATTDQQGAYSMEIETGGVALDGYIKATIASYLDTYLYPPAPLGEDFTNASINIVNSGTVNLFGTLCGVTIDTAAGVIAVRVASATGTAFAGVMIASTPGATHYCYNGASASIPSSSATMTSSDGIGYMLGVTGSASVTATKSGATFAAHTINARAGALTTTIISGQ